MARRGLWNRIRDRSTRHFRELVVPDDPPEVPEEDPEAEVTRQTLRILHLIMDVLELMLTSGASAEDVADTGLRISRAFGLRGVHCDVIYTSITVSWQRPLKEPISTLRVVRSRETDYSRLQRTQDLVFDIVAEKVTVEEAQSRFRRIAAAAHPYRPWVTTAAQGVMSCGIAATWQASPIVLLVTFVATCLVRVALHNMERRRIPGFFRQAVGAAIVTTATLATTYAQAKGLGIFQEVQPQLIVSAGIVVLLAGLSVVGAAQDSIDGHYVTAAARTFEVLVMTMGIVAGILVVLRVGQWVGISILVSTEPPASSAPLQVVIATVVLCTAFAVTAYSGWLTTILAGVMGVVTWLAFQVATIIGFGVVGGSAFAAAVAATFAVFVTARISIPSLALITAAIVTLLPGSAVFRGVLLLTSADSPEQSMTAITHLLSAAGVGLALAAGSSLGTWVMRPAVIRLSRAAMRKRA